MHTVFKLKWVWVSGLYHCSISCLTSLVNLSCCWSIICDRMPACDKRLEYDFKSNAEIDLEQKRAENSVNAFRLNVLSYYWWKTLETSCPLGLGVSEMILSLISHLKFCLQLMCQAIIVYANTKLMITQWCINWMSIFFNLPTLLSKTKKQYFITLLVW